MKTNNLVDLFKILGTMGRNFISDPDNGSVFKVYLNKSICTANNRLESSHTCIKFTPHKNNKWAIKFTNMDIDKTEYGYGEVIYEYDSDLITIDVIGDIPCTIQIRSN